MDFSFITKYYPFFINGAKFTIIISFFAVILGVVGGVIIALMKMSKNKILKGVSSAYVEFIRGTPSLVQLYIVVYGLPNAGIHIPDIVAGVIALGINSSAYVAEIVRAGIQAVDRGQMEAARSLGMKEAKAMRYIIIPQAIKNILPALGNEFIVVVKESSIVSIVGIHELMYNADTVRSVLFKPFIPLVIAALIYFVITFTLSRIVRKFEGRLKLSD
ncbi:amino acid ABC transporter permease [Clostridium sp. cel8]|uniref:amino acid ABC transporter permease n=1 Tax=unclassified Clostridium TaxID=2614128 RepID=UPI0015F3EDD8|nr:amino acid ABC transporter permease [Clostridium sp. cel8]MBA5852029.1 amino acid ABC transporter permease [Clostridium sp. cel8]